MKILRYADFSFRLSIFPLNNPAWKEKMNYFISSTLVNIWAETQSLF